MAWTFFEKHEGAASAPLCAYERREPEKTVLYQVVSAHLETMLAEVRTEDEHSEAPVVARAQALPQPPGVAGTALWFAR